MRPQEITLEDYLYGEAIESEQFNSLGLDQQGEVINKLVVAVDDYLNEYFPPVNLYN